MFYEKIDPANAEKLMPEVLQQALAHTESAAMHEPGVLRLLRELTQSNLFRVES